MGTYSVKTVANEFIDISSKSDKPLTNMQLQKLVFIANGFSLAMLDNALYHDDTNAWQWGPVIPNLYKVLQKYGRNFVTEKLACHDELPLGEDQKEIINAVWEGYGHLSAYELSTITHKPNTPWSKSWRENHFSVIPEKLISEHYLNIIEST